MRILFLDQSGKPGGAELSLMDLAKSYGDHCLIALFEDGPFRERLEEANIPVTCLAQQGMKVSKDSRWWQSLGSLGALLGLLKQCLRLCQDYDLLYANTSKALVLGALASTISRRPLVYHLRDILSREHFSESNLRIAVTLANRCATAIIANSNATRDAFIQAGGNSQHCHVVYNGFDPEQYQMLPEQARQLRNELDIPAKQFVIGHFSRLSPWKGQHVLIDAVSQLSPEVRSRLTVLLVGSALFGEDDYVDQLQQRVQALGLEQVVQFLGFRSDISQLMTACDLVVHSSTSPEPFGRVIIEAMFCGTPVVAAQAGGAVELIEPEETGWLSPPGDTVVLGKLLERLIRQPERLEQVASTAERVSRDRFRLEQTQQQVHQILGQCLGDDMP